MKYEDIEKIERNTKNKDKLKVILKKTKEKGTGLFATQLIEKDEIISFYKIKIFKKKNYKSPTNFIYSFEVYRKNGKAYKTLIGDIDKESFPQPVDNITFWAPFANEPSKNEEINSEVQLDLKKNYANKNYSSPGDIMIYELKAIKNIEPGEEILWFYGEGYDRDYEIKKN